MIVANVHLVTLNLKWNEPLQINAVLRQPPSLVEETLFKEKQDVSFKKMIRDEVVMNVF